MTPLPTTLIPAVAVAVALGLAACGQPVPEEGWPAPDPDRPVVDLVYEFAADHSSVDGRESITFAPDREVCEIVLRAWPNKPATAAAGNALHVEQVVVDGRRLRHESIPAGAPTGSPGTLVEVPLDECRPAGESIQIRTDFTLTLGAGTDERLGRDPGRGIAWLGSAYPLLAWQREVGWVRDDAEDVMGEMSTAETFELNDLTVIVPTGQQVAGVGRAGTVEQLPEGRAAHHFSAPAMRDVAVTVGAIRTATTQVQGVDVHLVVPEGTGSERERRWQEMIVDDLTALEELLGPLPYEDLWVSVIPSITDGIELTGAVQLTQVRGRDRWLVTHELAHQWFYGLVGNNQALHPWLDEALTTYAQQRVRAEEGWEPGRSAQEGELGRAMSYWADQDDHGEAYSETVYTYGADLLRQAWERDGTALDDALRTYLKDNAHQIADPEDLRTALEEAPSAVDLLGRAGAWDTTKSAEGMEGTEGTP